MATPALSPFIRPDLLLQKAAARQHELARREHTLVMESARVQGTVAAHRHALRVLVLSAAHRKQREKAIAGPNSGQLTTANVFATFDLAERRCVEAVLRDVDILMSAGDWYQHALVELSKLNLWR